MMKTLPPSSSSRWQQSTLSPHKLSYSTIKPATILKLMVEATHTLKVQDPKLIPSNLNAAEPVNQCQKHDFRNAPFPIDPTHLEFLPQIARRKADPNASAVAFPSERSSKRFKRYFPGFDIIICTTYAMRGGR
jgi:hypothetical protein